VLVEEAEAARGVELLTFAQKHPQTPPIYLDIAARWFSNIEMRLAPETLLAARERGSELELEAVVETVLRERPAEQQPIG
jgi:hypothetical protein